MTMNKNKIIDDKRKHTQINQSKTLPINLPLGRRFGILVRLYYGALTKRLEQLDIDRHFSILIFLENNDGTCNQQFISNLLKIDKVSMVRIIDYLVKRKYVKRVVNIDDRREHQIHLTNKARKMLPVIHTAVDSLNEVAMGGFSPKKVKNLYKDIDTLISNLEAEPAHTITMKFEIK